MLFFGACFFCGCFGPGQWPFFCSITNCKNMYPKKKEQMSYAQFMQVWGLVILHLGSGKVSVHKHEIQKKEERHAYRSGRVFGFRLFAVGQLHFWKQLFFCGFRFV